MGYFAVGYPQDGICPSFQNGEMGPYVCVVMMPWCKTISGC
jgi:hypothetical protein